MTDVGLTSKNVLSAVPEAVGQDPAGGAWPGTVLTLVQVPLGRPALSVGLYRRMLVATDVQSMAILFHGAFK